MDSPLFARSLFVNGTTGGFSAEPLIFPLLFWRWSYAAARWPHPRSLAGDAALLLLAPPQLDRQSEADGARKPSKRRLTALAELTDQDAVGQLVQHLERGWGVQIFLNGMVEHVGEG